MTRNNFCYRKSNKIHKISELIVLNNLNEFSKELNLKFKDYPCDFFINMNETGFQLDCIDTYTIA